MIMLSMAKPRRNNSRETNTCAVLCLIDNSPVETFECATEVRLEELKDLTIRLPNLNIVPETTTYKTTLVDILRLYSRTTESKWTFVTPSTGKEVTLSVFSTSELTASGFYVKDTTCWAKIVSLVKSVPTRFSIVYKA